MSIPTDGLSPVLRCRLENGFYILEVHQPPVPGATPFYVLGSDLDSAAARAASDRCRQQFSPYQEKTSDEIRQIYANWVRERDCLVRLGYDPAEPPSVETFIAEWKTGPWMPVDGVDTSAWTDDEYRTAKVECKLEMFDR